ncbi:hypothetical protein PJJ26_00620 (plasmid) [Tenacibaculum finnmarkense]|nr:hypothetical protein PJJ26_00620 [Tenacibaculum finnmarkense]
MSVGIAKIAPRDTNLQADENLVIIPASEGIKFAVYLYGNTKNEQATKDAIKWVWVEEKYLSQLRAMTKENKFEHWGKWFNKEKKPLNLYGIGINYAKSTSINISNLSGSIGKKYWLEAFVLYPEFKHPVGKYFTIKGKPAILSAYFEGAAIGECNDLVKSKYGKTINLIINTHSLPDVTLSYHNYVVFEIDIYNKEKNKKVTKEPFRSYVDFAQGDNDLNGTIKTGIILEDSWRKEVAHNNSDETRSYYAVIKATHYFNKDAVYNGEEIPGIKPGSSFTKPKGAPNGEQVAFTITKEDWEKKHWMDKVFGRNIVDVKAAAAKYQSTVINFKATDSKGEQLPLYVQLPYTTQGEAIETRTIEAGKMLAAIKDKKYTCKEYNPCKFTGIEVKVGEKTPTVIFNENEDKNSDTEVTDNTTKVFSFIAGDSKKETVKITLKELSITDFGNDDGEIKCVAPVAHTKKNLIDATKVSPQWLVEKGSATDKKYSTYEVKKNTILLDMGYLYNKDYDVRAREWLGDAIGNRLNDFADIAWMVRYFYLDTSSAQSYYLPISTCRYPSQMIRLKVYPDFKWEIKVKFSSELHTYIRESHIGKDGKEKVSKKSKKKYKFGDREYNLSIETKVKINGVLTKITLKKPPLENEIRLVLWFIHVVKKVTFTKDFAMPELNNPKKTFDRRQKEREKAHKKVGKTITVGVPSFDMLFEGAFKESANNPTKIGSEYRIGGAISWVIAGKLDLLYYAKFMGPLELL